MTKFKIVEIDLDFELDKMIEKEQSSISTETHNMITQAIATARQKEEIKQSAVKEKTAAEEKKKILMEDIYKKLLDNFREGVPISTIYEMGAEISTSPGGFTTKFKKYLVDEKNQKYVLSKITKNRTQYFILLPNEASPTT